MCVCVHFSCITFTPFPPPPPPSSILSYAVFALGNKTYEHYNDMGRYVDQRLADLGAHRVYQRGEGDDDAK